MNRQFSFGHDAVIKEFHFGISRDGLEYSISPFQEATEKEFHSDRPIDPTVTPTVPLFRVFDKASKDLQAQLSLWVEIEFIDGSKTKPRLYKKPNRYGHDGSVESARVILSELHPQVSMGHLKGGKFLLAGLARVGAALEFIEVGNSPSKLTNRLPIRLSTREGYQFLSFSESKRIGILFDRDRLNTNLKLVNEVIINDGVMINPIAVPPVWSEIYYRGHWLDGTVTPMYRTINEDKRVGFVTDVLNANTAFPQIPIHALVPRAHGSSHADVFSMQKLELVAILPAEIQRVEYYEDKKFTASYSCEAPGEFYAKFLDHQSSLVTTGHYRVNAEAFRTAIVESCIPLVDKHKEQLVRAFRPAKPKFPLKQHEKRYFRSSKYQFYRQVLEELGASNPNANGVMITGIPLGGFWASVKEVRIRFGGNGDWESYMLNREEQRITSHSTIWFHTKPIFMRKASSEEKEIEAVLVLIDGTQTEVFMVAISDLN